MLLVALALVAAACGGGESACSTIVADGVDLFQDAIDELEGLTLADLSLAGSDPFSSEEFDRRGEELERRTQEAGCTDEEMSKLLVDQLDQLEVGANNPAGQLVVSILQQAAEQGEFSVDFDG